MRSKLHQNTVFGIGAGRGMALEGGQNLFVRSGRTFWPIPGAFLALFGPVLREILQILMDLGGLGAGFL